MPKPRSFAGKQLHEREQGDTTVAKKVIRFLDTSFRDGFQSVFRARVLTDDFIGAVKASVDAGITKIEAGGGARFQSLFFTAASRPST